MIPQGTQELPQKISAHSVKLFGQLYLTYLYELYYKDMTLLIISICVGLLKHCKYFSYFYKIFFKQNYRINIYKNIIILLNKS